MYRLPKFEYFKARSVENAVELLSKYKNAKLLAGGTDLLVDMKIGRVKPDYVIDISGIEELRYIVDTGESLNIGSLTTIQDILDSPVVKNKTPLLREVALKFAYWQVRNTATIGGNICNASPAADFAPPLLSYEAVLRTISSRGERFIPVTEFFQGPRQTTLRDDEILLEVIIPYKHLERAGFSYMKIGRRQGHDISIVSIAALVVIVDNTIIDARVALNSVASKPVRARSVEQVVINREPAMIVFEEASRQVEKDISPITDIRAPAEYRLHIAKILTREALLEASKRALRCGFE
ncbi:MAG: xanthine dehydrogenase family protein subunit M [Desulfurococcaceae archaeon]